MPDGTLTVSLNDLQGALSGVVGLLGEADASGGGTKFAGAANVASAAPGDQVQQFGATFTAQAQGALSFDPGAIDQATTLLTQLQSQPGVPTDALDHFVERLTTAGDAFGGDLVGHIEGALTAIRGLSGGIPTDRTAVVSALLDQILSVIGALDGPEAAQIRAWAQSVQEMLRLVGPLIEQASAAGDPSSIAVAVSRRALESALEVFGFPQVQRLLTLFDEFPLNALPSAQLDATGGALTTVSAGYTALAGLASAPYPQFRDQAVALAADMEALRVALRPVLGGIRRVADAPILQPGALEAFLRQHIDEALGVQVTEAQRIDDPFQALFDRIDAAIDGIDLSAVRDSVLGFFEQTRSAIEQLDVPSLADTLATQLQAVDGVIGDLESGVTGTLDEVRSFFDDATAQVHTLAEQVGSFAGDGSFHFDAEAQLRGALVAARTAIGGDPANPSAPSVRGTLEQFRDTLDGFLGQINTLLGGVAGEIDGVRSAAVDGVNAFRDFVTGLDLPGKVETLRDQVQAILDQLGPIDFSAVVDPVVEGINDNTGKLRDIDTSSLNELLRQALAAALDVVISIDFTADISAPLDEEFQAAKDAAAQPVAELQRRYEDAVAQLDQLSPTQLLEGLFHAFDTIDAAVGSLDLTNLLAPLDALHTQYLVDPVAALKPSTLLQPVVDAQRAVVDQFASIDPAALIAPLTGQLDAFKSQVAAFDVAQPVEDLRQAVAKVRSDIGDLHPSDLLQPLVDDFARLEGLLDQLSPSVLMAPAAQLATPLLALLDRADEALITALHDLFQAPLAALDRLRPSTLAQELSDKLNQVIAAIRGMNLASRFNQLKGAHFDLMASVQAGGSQAHLGLVMILDPQRQLGAIVDAHNALLTRLEQIRDALVFPDLEPLFEQVQTRMLAMLPPYARELLDRDTFLRVMRLADPTRFLGELDTRFQALKDKLIPIRPADIAAELDASYNALLAVVDGLDIDAALGRITDTLNRIKGVVAGVRIDFVAGDLQHALDDLRAVLAALDISPLLDELDGIHGEVVSVVEETRPSTLLSSLGATLATVQGIVSSVNPRTALGGPLSDAWSAVEDALAGVDFSVLLQPLIDKLDELEAAFRAALQRVESAFDAMLSAGRGALAGGGGAGAAAGAGVSL